MTGNPAQRTLPVFLAWLEQSRQSGQVHYDAKQQSWQVLGHPEAVAVLSDPATFSSDLTHLFPAQDDLALFQKGNFVRMDPPRHRKLRGLVSQAFTPRMLAGLEPRIAEVTTELLDATGGSERLDLIESLAYPLPVIVIAELLGIPSTDRPTFRRWADTLFDQADIDPEDSLRLRRRLWRRTELPLEACRAGPRSKRPRSETSALTSGRWSRGPLLTQRLEEIEDQLGLLKEHAQRETETIRSVDPDASEVPLTREPRYDDEVRGERRAAPERCRRA